MIHTDPRLCQSCRFWERYHSWLGACHRDAEAHENQPGIEFRWSGDNCREEVLLDTHPHFGCVLWEEADHDPS